MPKPLTQTTGRRKQAVARVRLRPGTGKITINKRTFEDYFPSPTHRMIASEPLRLAEVEDTYDVDATMDGGGVAGQAGALRLGIARSLVELDEESALAAQEGRLPHPRPPREGIEEGRPEEGPQGAAVLQALAAWRYQRLVAEVRHRRCSRCRVRRTDAGTRSGTWSRRGAGARHRRAVLCRSRHARVRSAVASGVDRWADLGRRVASSTSVSFPRRALPRSRRRRNAPGAVVSASHNPYADNGVKFFARGGLKLTDAYRGGDSKHRMAEIVREAPAAGAPGPSKADHDSIATYETTLLDSLDGRRLDGLSVVLDCANGAASTLAPRVFAAAGASVVVLQRPARRPQHQRRLRVDAPRGAASCGGRAPAPMSGWPSTATPTACWRSTPRAS